MPNESYRLLELCSLGTITLRNRIVVAPMGNSFANPDGSINQRLVDYYTRYARGGAGLVMTESMRIDDKEGTGTPNMLALQHDRYIFSVADMVESVKDEGAAFIAQLCHAGYQTKPEYINGLQPVAPSRIFHQGYRVWAREMNQDDISSVQNNFAATALRAMIAGFDGVEIHGANGYLLTQFLSPRLNVRVDKYGGSIDNRARMVLETYEKVRAKTSPRFIIGYRICADEGVPGGITPEDVVNLAKMLEEAGINYISVSVSTHESIVMGMPPIYLPRGSFLPWSEMIKKAVRVPVMCAGGLNVEIGEQAIREGKTDLVVMGRGLIADPELPRKLTEGKIEDIRPCIRGNVGCLGRGFSSKTISCEVNPSIGQDANLTVTPAKIAKKVLVIGGGVGGMEAARLAAERGHKVTLIERGKELGGHLLEASSPEFKQELRPLLTWLKTQLNKEGVTIKLGNDATPEMVKRAKPDVLIIAVGSEYTVPPDLVKDAANFTFPDEVLLGRKNIGDKVVVAGGGFIGSETALYIAEALKKKVTIVEMLDDILLDSGDLLSKIALTMRLNTAGVEIKTGMTVKGYSEGKVTCTDKKGETQQIDADAVVLATGLKPRQELVAKFEGMAPQTYKVGDCVQAGKIYHAFRSAWRAVFAF